MMDQPKPDQPTMDQPITDQVPTASTAGGTRMRDHLRRLGGTALTLAALVAVGAVLPSIAQDSNQRDMGQARHQPTLSANRYVFKAGILQRDHLARWMLSDGTLLRTDDQTVWVDEASRSAEAFPAEGRAVRLMGQMGPGGLTVLHGVLRDQVEVAQEVLLAPETVPDTLEPNRPQ